MRVYYLSMQAKFPLFVRAKDSGEVNGFDSLYKLQAAVEKIDIENGEYQAWDKDGIPVGLTLQNPIWIKAELLSEITDPEGLRQALVEFAKSINVYLPDHLPIKEFESALSQVRGEQERRLLAGSRVRRILARFKKSTS